MSLKGKYYKLVINDDGDVHLQDITLRVLKPEDALPYTVDKFKLIKQAYIEDLIDEVQFDVLAQSAESCGFCRVYFHRIGCLGCPANEECDNLYNSYGHGESVELVNRALEILNSDDFKETVKKWELSK